MSNWTRAAAFVAMLFPLAACGGGAGSDGGARQTQTGTLVSTGLPSLAPPPAPSPNPTPAAPVIPTATPSDVRDDDPTLAGPTPSPLPPSGAPAPWFPGEPTKPTLPAQDDDQAAKGPAVGPPPIEGQQPVPEPATIVLFMIGSIGLLFVLWRRGYLTVPAARSSP
jgi:hypothetical protein